MMFTEIVPTREITTIIEKIFLVFSSVAVGLFLECPNAVASTAPISSSIVCHNEAHNNWRLVHSAKPARYVRPFQFNAGLWQTDRRTDGHVAIANTSLIRAGKKAQDYATIASWEAANTLVTWPHLYIVSTQGVVALYYSCTKHTKLTENKQWEIKDLFLPVYNDDTNWYRQVAADLSIIYTRMRQLQSYFLVTAAKREAWRSLPQ